MSIKHYLNLSNGIEALASVRASRDPFAFVRFRSTTLEKANWFHLFESELSDDLLMHLALGWECILHDRGTRRPLSKTCYFGVPLIRYVLHRRWFDSEPLIDWTGPRGGTGLDRTDFLREIYDTTLEAPSARAGELKKRLDYYRRFTSSPVVRLVGKSISTERDGDHEYQIGLSKCL